MVVPETLPPPQRFAFARDRRTWTGDIRALEIDRDGHLSLMSLPGPDDGVPVVLPGPYAAGASGIAAGPCGVVFVADTLHHRVVFIDTRCQARAELPPSAAPSSTPGGFHSPRGLAVGAAALGVADSGNARLQHRLFPGLDPGLSVTSTSAGTLKLLTGVGVDSKDRWYLLDEIAARVVRVDTLGFSDPVYDAALAAAAGFVTPAFLAVSPDDVLFVSDTGRQLLLAFDDQGALLYTLKPPIGWSPGAVAATRDRVYVHDTVAGTIHVFAGKNHSAVLPGWTGPVTAMAVDDDGNLLIKPGLDDAYFLFRLGAAHAVSGSVTAGPLDAGERLEWSRAALDAITLPYTTAVLEVFQSASNSAPTAADWMPAASSDTRLANLVPSAPPQERRFLWMRATLETRDTRVSPVLRQMRAETPGEDYLEYLPAIYRRTDPPAHDLAGLLSLARTEQGTVDEHLDAMPQRFSPRMAPASSLPWLAQWLDFELPAAAPDDERRALIETAVARHERRGTPGSIRDFVELFTGIRPQIIEAFNFRGLWRLDEESLLGCDTVLPAAEPDGVVVPDPCAAHQGEPPRCCPPERGQAVVGESGPLRRDDYGLPLFLDTAFRFDVLVPRHRAAAPGVRDLIRRILDREKPAHTQYCLCLFDSELRVGLQALVGVDTIVGGSEPQMRLDASHLDSSIVGPAREAAVRVGVIELGEATPG